MVLAIFAGVVPRSSTEVSVIAGLLLMALGYALLGSTPVELARAPPFLPAVRAADVRPEWRRIVGTDRTGEEVTPNLIQERQADDG